MAAMAAIPARLRGRPSSSGVDPAGFRHRIDAANRPASGEARATSELVVTLAEAPADLRVSGRAFALAKNSVIPTEAERNEAQWRGLSCRSINKKGPSTAPPMALCEQRPVGRLTAFASQAPFSG
jgi:hypothetical protein